MIYNRSNGKAILQNPAATGIMLQSNEKCEYVYLAVNPHARIERHALSIPVTFFVIHGSGELILDGTVYSVTKCDLVEVAADVPREWINTTDSTLEVLAIKHLKEA